VGDHLGLDIDLGTASFEPLSTNLQTLPKHASSLLGHGGDGDIGVAWRNSYVQVAIRSYNGREAGG
jgi:hypothetical protein